MTMIEEDKQTASPSLTIRKQVEDILVDVSWSEISGRYFGKSPSWLSKKMSGKGFNGGEGGFSEDEKETLRNALLDLSRRIEAVAQAIQ